MGFLPEGRLHFNLYFFSSGRQADGFPRGSGKILAFYFHFKRNSLIQYQPIKGTLLYGFLPIGSLEKMCHRKN